MEHPEHTHHHEDSDLPHINQKAIEANHKEIEALKKSVA
jgi:hypothetical protein|tara:strand:- start:167 stop:283 length:117 start_codon:yes stop_codon:yes gene_type:complete